MSCRWGRIGVVAGRIVVAGHMIVVGCSRAAEVRIVVVVGIDRNRRCCIAWVVVGRVGNRLVEMLLASGLETWWWETLTMCWRTVAAALLAVLGLLLAVVVLTLLLGRIAVAGASVVVGS